MQSFQLEIQVINKRLKACRPTFFFLVALILIWNSPSYAGEVQVAVASNFLNPLREIARSFQKETGDRVQIISGSTGKLFAQIVHGAPFEIFLAADQTRPALLLKRGLAVKDSAFTYAQGKIALWSPKQGKVSEDGISTLKAKRFKHLAIANPKTAPYGSAARQTLQKLGLWDSLRQRLVQGENISQTFQFVSSENADLGFVALSQILDPKNKMKGSRWLVPETYYKPINQDAVILKKAKNNSTAKAFWKYMQGGFPTDVINRYGYGPGLPGD